MSDAACFEHAIASTAEAASFKRANRKKSQGNSAIQEARGSSNRNAEMSNKKD